MSPEHKVNLNPRRVTAEGVHGEVHKPIELLLSFHQDIPLNHDATSAQHYLIYSYCNYSDAKFIEQFLTLLQLSMSTAKSSIIRGQLSSLSGPSMASFQPFTGLLSKGMDHLWALLFQGMQLLNLKECSFYARPKFEKTTFWSTKGGAVHLRSNETA